MLSSNLPPVNFLKLELSIFIPYISSAKPPTIVNNDFTIITYTTLINISHLHKKIPFEDYILFGCPSRIRTYGMSGSEPDALPLGYWAISSNILSLKSVTKQHFYYI